MPMTKLRKNLLNINDARIAGLYDLEHTIGKGHFAVVKLAKHVFTGEKVAVKVIDKTRLDPISTSHMMQEVRCMKLVQHPNIVRLYEVIDTQTKLFIILELGDYDMYEWVMKRGYDKGGCREADAQLYFSQIIKAINYCHKLHVVHRDLKPENVVFFEKLGMVKLTDFGFSNLFTPGQQLETSCGSLAYSAPEILLGDAYDAPAVDVWSLGVILYMLVSGRLPFQESNDSETLTRILDCKFSFPDHVSLECRRLISSMLVRDPTKRATLSEIVQNRWVCAGDRGHAEALPLIVREHLPLCAHTTIVEQMVAGNIGSEEEIHSAIEHNEYNHLTATYYLLAERVLSCYRLAQANRLMQQQLQHAATAARDPFIDDGSSTDPVSQLVDVAAAVVSSSTVPGASTSSSRSRSRSNSWRGPAPRRAYSILKEESEEELSTYFRSTSRQSSRFFNIPPPPSAPKARDSSSRASLLATSRANSNDSFAPGSSAILEDDVEMEVEEAATAIAVSSTEVQNQVAEAQPKSAIFAPFEMAPPSATSTPFLQRLLAPIDENRDQSPDRVIENLKNDTNKCPTSNTGNIFSFEQLELQDYEEVDDALVLRHPPPNKPVLLARAIAGTSGLLPPPPPASPERHLLLRRPLRNAASLEFFPAIAATSNRFDIVENGGPGGGSLMAYSRLLNQQCPSTSPPTPNPITNKNFGASSSNAWNITSLIASGVLERHPNYTNLSALPSTSSLNIRPQRKSSSFSLSRRNSSPSVSTMFQCVNSLHSSRDRISPHAIQELLEFSRLSGHMRRTASPDSRLSSRSPSPSCMSSGRVSPVFTGIMSRMKANTFLPSSGGGMRKLSSSPHLLGICEETEELEGFDGNCHQGNQRMGDANAYETGSTGKDSGKSSCYKNSISGRSPMELPMTRSARSASMGLTSMSRLSFGTVGNGSNNNKNNSSKSSVNIRKVGIQQHAE